jgi:hypothetical protein
MISVQSGQIWTMQSNAVNSIKMIFRVLDIHEGNAHCVNMNNNHEFYVMVGRLRRGIRGARMVQIT